MTRRIPSVRNGTLYEDAEEIAACEAIAVESVAWYAWLEHHRSFRFECHASTFTARKEQRAGGWYWYAYRRQAGRLHTAYLGRSAELSATRLQAIAAALSGAGEPPTPRMVADERGVDPYASQVQEQANVTTRRPVPLHNLPRQLTSLVGREQETAAAAALLQRPEVHLLSMVGTAGVGKTRLALQIAFDLLECFADGVFFVDLAPVSEAELVLSTVAQTLGLQAMGDQSFLDVLKAHLRDKHCLLVLDNFEQVVGAALQLPDLLRACPDVKLLVTSREALHLRAEYQFSVPPLALPDCKRLPATQTLAHVAAVQLFLQRVQASKSDFELTPGNAAAIAEVCIRLDGLPLAIELAAARVNVFTPQVLLSRLDHRLQVLTGGIRDLPLRQQTLRNTIAWSYELLLPEEQRLFRQLAVFVGGCTLVAAEAMSSALGDSSLNVLEGMISLVDKSLLQHAAHDGEEPRFAMLETIREYGLEMLASAGEARAAHEAHAAYYLALVEQAEPELRSQEQLGWFERLEREHDNLRAALSWVLEQGSHGRSNELAMRFGGALARFWRTRGYVSEGRRWLERGLEISRGVKSAVRANALVGAGHLAALQDDVGQAEVLCGEGLSLYSELGDRRGRATALTFLGYAALLKSNYAQARMHLEEALTLFREVGDTGDAGLALSILGSVLVFQGEYARAQVLLEESLMRSETAGDVRDRAFSLVLLGRVLMAQGDLAQAQARLEASRALSRKIGYKRNIGLANHSLGLIAFRQGDLAGARSLLEESLIHFREVGERGRMAEVLVSQGLISLRQGDSLAACRLLKESLKLSLELNHTWNIAGGLEGLAAVAATQGDPGQACRLMSAAQALREGIGTPLPPVFQALHEFTIASARTQLGEQAFAAAWDEGRKMPLEQALAEPGAVAIPTRAPAGPSSDPHEQKASTFPNGLTAREVEVLRLLAQGLTSAQIAEQLVIGVVTVNFHVRSIYSKLAVSSRSAATRYAIEHHLV